MAALPSPDSAQYLHLDNLLLFLSTEGDLIINLIINGREIVGKDTHQPTDKVPDKDWLALRTFVNEQWAKKMNKPLRAPPTVPVVEQYRFKKGTFAKVAEDTPAADLLKRMSMADALLTLMSLVAD